MAFTHTAEGHFEVVYRTAEDMAPESQAGLLRALETALAAHPVSILFLVEKLAVPRAVPEFWLGVTTRYAPKLCAMAIVSDSMAVRAAANFFAVANTVRRVKVAVQAFGATEKAAAERWCTQTRLGAGTAQVA